MEAKIKIKESDIQKAILEYLQYLGVFAIRLNNIPVPLSGGGFRPVSRKGLPDLFGVIPSKKGFGIPLFIEIKTPKGKLSESQEQFMAEADAAGALCLIAISVEFVEQKLKPYL